MEQKEFTYDIDGKKYIQRELVLGQLLLLIVLLKHIRIDASMDIAALIASIGLKMPEALAIVLIPAGAEISDKGDDEKRRSLAKELSFSIKPDVVFTVVEDFFDCNPIASLLERITGLMEKLTLNAVFKNIKNPASNPSSSSSQTETSPDGSQSSGGTPLENASPT